MNFTPNDRPIHSHRYRRLPASIENPVSNLIYLLVEDCRNFLTSRFQTGMMQIISRYLKKGVALSTGRSPVMNCVSLSSRSRHVPVTLIPLEGDSGWSPATVLVMDGGIGVG